MKAVFPIAQETGSIMRSLYPRSGPASAAPAVIASGHHTDTRAPSHADHAEKTPMPTHIPAYHPRSGARSSHVGVAVRALRSTDRAATSLTLTICDTTDCGTQATVCHFAPAGSLRRSAAGVARIALLRNAVTRRHAAEMHGLERVAV